MSDLLQEGVQLLMLGMGSVFVFLIILIVGTSLMSAIVGRFQAAAPPAPNGPVSKRVNGSRPESVAAVAAAAYAAHSGTDRTL